jgi:hypothetical protein
MVPGTKAAPFPHCGVVFTACMVFFFVAGACSVQK